MSDVTASVEAVGIAAGAAVVAVAGGVLIRNRRRSTRAGGTV
jgi:hypothetical protein